MANNGSPNSLRASSMRPCLKRNLLYVNFKAVENGVGGPFMGKLPKPLRTRLTVRYEARLLRAKRDEL
ncbi:MAG: hypothetical protein RMK18_02865 [Armatimonadota bacterium]|nr:hypothetical protein [Armatimonadota bacterium]MCX7776962.1 hypothetical protein [Armatimonadota bacterium]MDW8024796.1 hypothetical protein [Armatimonadota bacterium]